MDDIDKSLIDGTIELRETLNEIHNTMEQIKIKYVLKNKNTGKIHYKKYTLSQIAHNGLRHLFDIDNYEIISKDKFTGKKTNKGEEIYEGDILNTHDGANTKTVVVWIDDWCMFGCLLDYEYPSFLENGAKELDEMSFWTFPLEGKDHEIIGNIHENKNLLK